MDENWLMQDGIYPYLDKVESSKEFKYKETNWKRLWYLDITVDEYPRLLYQEPLNVYYNLKFFNTNIHKIYLGDISINKIYIGDNIL